MSLPTVGWHQRLPHTHKPHNISPTPAYHAVSARQTLTLTPTEAGRGMRPYGDMSYTTTQEQAPASPAKPRRVEWSSNVREYVQRSFDPDHAIPGIERSEMETKLKELLSYYAERNMLDDVDWARHALPQHIIVEEKRRAAEAATGYYGWNNNSVPNQLTTNGTTNPVLASSPPESKKRKSLEEYETEEAGKPIPPWRKGNKNLLEDRMTRSAKVGGEKRRKKGEGLAADNVSRANQADLERRKQRFMTGGTTPPRSLSPDSDSEFRNGPVIGTCENIEKRYLRLTAPPKPETVRPQRVLQKTLDFLKLKWRKENNYGYICDQFKSLRQDLTVQHIKNAFTVSVYEIHARIALEKGDLGEYNQCQTQLRALYAQQLGGHPDEFLAYRILYYLYTCNQTDMNDILAELTAADKTQPYVKHALDVRSALALGNYHRFFRLYLAAPNMGAYLMDTFVERERLAALSNFSRAYVVPFSRDAGVLTVSRYFHIALRSITDGLGFETDGECVGFLENHGLLPFVKDTDSGPRLVLKDAKGLIESLRAAAFSKVDIKGQI